MTTGSDSQDEQARTEPRFGPPTTANPLWRVTAAAGAAFCFSCLLWITAGFGNPEAPGSVWLNRHGLLLIVVTGIACVGAAVSAMALDGMQTRRMRADEQPCQHDAASETSAPQP